MKLEIFSRFSVFRMRKSWYLRIVAGNGEIVLSSEGHRNRLDVLAMAHNLRKTLSTAEVTEL